MVDTKVEISRFVEFIQKEGKVNAKEIQERFPSLSLMTTYRKLGVLARRRTIRAKREFDGKVWCTLYSIEDRYPERTRVYASEPLKVRNGYQFRR